MDRNNIARIAHEINRAYCAALGDVLQVTWEDAPEWQKASALAGVDMHLANPDATPENSHESWLAQKLAEGWKYGPVKDAEKKEHPCCVPYAELPSEQKAKDYLFRATVHLMKDIQGPSTAQRSEGPNVEAKKVPDDRISVHYIGRRPEWEDTLYGTGLSFVTDQTRHLPPATARQLLRHADLFVEAPVEVATEPQQALAIEEAPKDDTDEVLEAARQREAEAIEKENRLQDLRQSISFMDKDALKEFVQTHYRQKLDGRLSVEVMRTQAQQMIDQFGAP